MRLALLADIHGNLAALDAVLMDLSRRRVDRVINLGDHASGPLMPAETVRRLRSQEGWLHLAGNHERQLLTLEPEAMNLSDRFTLGQLEARDLAWMRDQTASRALGELGLEEEVWLCHGSPRSDVEYLLETVTKQGVRPATPEEISVRCGERGVSAGLIACAHTHIPRVVRAPGGALVVNPGSVGLPAYDDTSPYHHVMEAGSPHARYAVLERSDSGWLCQLLSIPYDHASMAALAEERGRQDWARALRNGFLS